MNLAFYRDSIDRLHQENLQFLRKQQYRRGGNFSAVEKAAEDAIVAMLRRAGYTVEKTSYKAPFDLFVNGVRVEVKGATWHNRRNHHSKGRYQARIHNHEFDILILDCINGSHHFFVIPNPAIFPRKHIEIPSYDVAEYTGHLKPYLEAWEVLQEAVEALQRNYQLSLW